VPEVIKNGPHWWLSDRTTFEFGEEMSFEGMGFHWAATNIRYFPQSQRLAILYNGKIKLYNTLNHRLGGVQQQQGGYSGSLTFSCQYGTFSVEALPLVSPGWGGPSSNPLLHPMRLQSFRPRPSRLHAKALSAPCNLTTTS
jgi:hypothetical protein